jgi:ABA DEFICIENT 4-like
METLFNISGLFVLPFWFLMILVPHWRLTLRLLKSPLVIIAPVIAYVILVLPQIGTLLPIVMAPKLPEIAALLGTPEGTTIAWMHFLAFDLFVGRWAFLDSRERGISAWLMAPILFFILMLGPLGFLVYLAVRLAKLKINHEVHEGHEVILKSK